ncbi:auxin-responsive protein IAA26-like isoform X2 [Apium graveolens]|uniref:auxin-responsive protein IAA26-like isoform X2 n=1 Tax=Apium graveolens TaxID=4045 RepID=UPI003D792251
MSGGYKEPNSQNGIVGRTGAGKSSILNVLFRLNQFSGGHILVDGVNIANILLRDLHSHFSVVPQPPFLFEGSLRTAPALVVGWPPIRSFRKNIASSTSSKLKVEPKQQNVAPTQKSTSKKQVEISCRGLFVKINMDGVPIGRKVDLKAYDSYDKLSRAVDELFRGLLAAQRDPCDDQIQNSDKREALITGLLDGRGEYTLLYEDNEGDRMLVGDVPWHMFVHTVKRLRVLKSSELPSLYSGSKGEERNLSDAALKKQRGSLLSG